VENSFRNKNLHSVNGIVEHAIHMTPFCFLGMVEHATYMALFLKNFLGERKRDKKWEWGYLLKNSHKQNI
jgi:hypothetical protein